MTSSWVVQGNPARWEDPDQLYRPITRWCVTGIHRDVEVDDGVLVWLANRDPGRRGVFAAGRVASPVSREDGGTPYVELDVDQYVVHDPVAVAELRETAFASHPILRMARRTAYPCSTEEYVAAAGLVVLHGPTELPARLKLTTILIP